MSATLKARVNDTVIYSDYDGDWRARGNKLSVLDKLNPWRFKYFDRFIPGWEGLEVLDIGCGAGFTAEFLAKRGARVSGIDPIEHALRAARSHAKTKNLAIEYLQGRAERLPYADATFDIVLCVDVLEHVGSLEKSLQEAGRVLKPGGYLLFDTINQTFRARVVMVWLLEYVIAIIPRGAHDWRMFVKPERLRQVLEHAGFGQIRLAGFPLKSITYIGLAQKNLR